MHLRDLRQLAERRGLALSHECRDEGFSGAKDSRPRPDAMLADARRGEFQVLLVWEAGQAGQIMLEQGDKSLLAWQNPHRKVADLLLILQRLTRERLCEAMSLDDAPVTRFYKFRRRV